ncbi:hypothetical protein N180_00505 [Pedobacter antarcticus 4BY]|uniref:DUF1349 domain-containing protein n=2 Tax=Pedobacter antarcticus TaxID=34086 RepID=A0A081PBT0_9SPHI|nr:DUF1349 domain-containing protein [Pedobacter antarcticus]KEQ28153.1 hypothetical protein N180_00505 [Pedobacter antarcticus 4BY]SFE43696.1 hypothetical protein SAMN03003324_00466 [Pedobacter antarcticus]
MKIKLLAVAGILALSAVQTVSAQSLEKMNWFNEPEQWSIQNKNTFKMSVPGKTDYWRISHYGFTVDDAPFYYATYGGEFETKVKITGNYVTTFDQMGIMLRIDHENWIKAGVEFVNGKQNVSAVVTHKTSDWSVVELEKAPSAIWIKAVRKLDAVEISYSLDDKKYTMIRTAWFKDNCPVMVGLVGASPDGKGFDAVFENFKVIQTPDQRRVDWADKQKK